MSQSLPISHIHPETMRSDVHVKTRIITSNAKSPVNEFPNTKLAIGPIRHKKALRNVNPNTPIPTTTGTPWNVWITVPSWPPSNSPYSIGTSPCSPAIPPRSTILKPVTSTKPMALMSDALNEPGLLAETFALNRSKQSLWRRLVSYVRRSPRRTRRHEFGKTGLPAQRDFRGAKTHLFQSVFTWNIS
jgi:hypothetical protein